MTVRWLQGVLTWLHRHFVCWHAWKPLKWYGLENEPVLAQCERCGYITKAIL